MITSEFQLSVLRGYKGIDTSKIQNLVSQFNNIPKVDSLLYTKTKNRVAYLQNLTASLKEKDKQLQSEINKVLKMRELDYIKTYYQGTFNIYNIISGVKIGEGWKAKITEFEKLVDDTHKKYVSFKKSISDYESKVKETEKQLKELVDNIGSVSWTEKLTPTVSGFNNALKYTAIIVGGFGLIYLLQFIPRPPRN